MPNGSEASANAPWRHRRKGAGGNGVPLRLCRRSARMQGIAHAAHGRLSPQDAAATKSCTGRRGILSAMKNDLSQINESGAHAARPVVGRFAPSPSGRMHLGNVFSCLVAWLSVKSQGGRIVLRIEDLDTRCRQEWADALMRDLEWLGLTWDKGPIYQHERTDCYEAALQALERAGLTYPCFCTRAELHAASAPHASDGTPIYAGSCRGLSPAEIARRSARRKPATRLRVPNIDDAADVIEFADRVYGAQREALAAECGDFLVRRSDGVFAYQLAVVVDDAKMGITEVVRGCDLLGSAPRQIYLQNLLGYEHPHYAHVPLLVAADGRRLSKRDGDCGMDALRERFGTPETLLGWLAGTAGIAPSTDPRSAAELAELFRWDAVRAHRENICIDLR